MILWRKHFCPPKKGPSTIIDDYIYCSELQDDASIYECEGYRLPTEAEWELVARSGTTYDFWTGEGSHYGGNIAAMDGGDCYDTLIDDGASNPSLRDYAWYCRYEPWDNPEDVGLKEPNGFGVYDMHGNIDEWTHDNFTEYHYSSSSNPVYHNGYEYSFTVKGGDIYAKPEYTGASIREDITCDISNYVPSVCDAGFRLVRSFEAVE